MGTNGKRNGSGDGKAIKAQPVLVGTIGDGGKIHAPAEQPANQPPRKLTAKQRRWVMRYCQHFNASRAAREAGYSEKTANVIGYENLTKPYIVAAVQEYLDKNAMSASEAVHKLTSWGRGSFEPFMVRDPEDGTLRMQLREDAPEEHVHLIKKVKQTTRSIVSEDGPEIIEKKIELELHDAKDATAKMAQIRGVLQAKGEMGRGGAPIQVNVYVGDPAQAVGE